MSTEKQINANRENSQHSTGPVTPEGKFAISGNRLAHGLACRSTIFYVLAWEEQGAFDFLKKTLLDENQPQNAIEYLLITSMAQHRWLLDRATRLQEGCFDPETGHVANQKLFALYLRYATTHERAFHKCLADFVNLRAATEKSRIGFEAQKRLTERHDLSIKIMETQSLYHQSKLIGSLSDEDRLRLVELTGQELKTAA